MRTTIQQNSRKDEFRSFSLNRILLEITNIEGFEAESEVAWNKFLNKVDYGNRKAKDTNEDRNSEGQVLKKSTSFQVAEAGLHNQLKNYKNHLVNDNIVIIDKTPSQLRSNSSNLLHKINHQNGKQDESKSKKLISKHEMPQPNTVSRFKDIFETLSFDPKPKEISTGKPGKVVGRSQSLCLTNTNNWQRKIDSTLNERPKKVFGNTFQTENKAVPTNFDDLGMIDLSSFRTEEDERREWLNGCSPVSPEVIQKIRQYGTSMTFFGRSCYSDSNSPIMMNGGYLHYDADWPKPKVVETTLQYSERKSIASLESSSTCSDEENLWENLNNRNNEVFDDGLYYYSLINFDENRPPSPEDYYSYDIVYLNSNYSRSTTPQLGLIHKGVWLKDPYWHGSSYIIYDFRGTDVKPQIGTK